MPRGDGTGPVSGSNTLQGRGKNKGTKSGSGLGGNCICPNCNTKVPHGTGRPCYLIKCPNCGTKMARE